MDKPKFAGEGKIWSTSSRSGDFATMAASVAEALRIVCHSLKNSDNLIFATLRKGIKLNGLVFLIEALGLVILQSSEHLAALNVMTVNDKVIAARNVAVFLNIRCSQVAVFFFKVALQIVVRLIRRLHHRVIEGRAGYGKPADHICVFQKQFAVLRKDIFFLSQGDFWCVTVLCLRLLHDCGNFRLFVKCWGKGPARAECSP